MSVWSLTQATIENFKAISNATVDILPGFTVITGPNGSGKSCFLESIGFGLGATAAELRVNNLSELCGNDCVGQRIRVVLKFINGLVSMTVGSSIIDGTRLYLINNSKVTKIKFSQNLTETLGFSKDSISWNISQRAVQEIIKASPKKLFDILCFVAGTNSVLEAKTFAHEQIAQSKSQLLIVDGVIKKLETDVEGEKKVLKMANEEELVQSAIRDAEQCLQLCEMVHESAKKYSSLTNALILAKDLLLVCTEESALTEDKTGTEEADTSIKRSILIGKYEASSMAATEAVSSKRSLILREKKTLSNLMIELDEQIILKEQTEQKLNARRLRSITEEQDRTVLIEASIPQICIRISSLEIRMATESSSILNAKAVIAQKMKQLTSELTDRELKLIDFATDVAKHSESLLMAVSAMATQQISTEYGLENQLRTAKFHKDSLEKKLISLEDAYIAIPPSHKTHNKSQQSQLRALKQQFDLVKTRVESIQQEIRGVKQALRLHSFPTGEQEGLNGGEDEGDLGFLADILEWKNEEASQHIVAMDAIIGSQFAVRICRDGDSASRLMKKAQTYQQQGLRIWPLDRLKIATARSSAYISVMKSFPDKTFDPVSLICISKNSDDSHRSVPFVTDAIKALYKVVGSWMIVDNDETAGIIIKSKAHATAITGCVTLSGNKHTVGALTVGKNRSDQTNGRHRESVTLQLELQIQYNKLKKSYNQITSEYRELESLIQTEERRVEQQHEREEIKPKLLELESQIRDITPTLETQRGKAIKAQRELALARGKLLDAETYREHIQKEMNSLTGSTGSSSNENGNVDERVQLMSNEQDKIRLRELMQKRDAMEKQAAILTATNYEVELDVSRLEGTIVFIDNASNVLQSKGHESERKLIAFQATLLQSENRAEDEKVNLAKCVTLKEEAEREENLILEKIEEVTEKKQLINIALQQAFKSCGLKTVTMKHNEYLEPLAVQKDIKREFSKTEKEMLEWVGQDIFESMVLEPQRYLKEARATLVDAREKVSALGAQAQNLQNSLAVSMASLGRKIGKGNDYVGNDLNGGSDSDTMIGASREKEKEKRKRQVDRNIMTEKMRETLMRKSTLLATVQLKYQQIQQSIEALEAGATAGDETIADLHTSTYSSLRGKCKRYFADLVPGKFIDLIPVTSDMVLENGLKFVLLSTNDTDQNIEGEKSHETRDQLDDEDYVKGSKMIGNFGSKSKKGMQRCQRSTDELSGGQMALLGLSFVFATALHKRSPLYLLDEVDAALDESNQKTIGAVIAKIFEKSQVVCVSHHTGFQEHAKTSIRVMMRDGHSVVDCSKPK